MACSVPTAQLQIRAHLICSCLESIARRLPALHKMHICGLCVIAGYICSMVMPAILTSKHLKPATQVQMSQADGAQLDA